MIRSCSLKPQQTSEPARVKQTISLTSMFPLVLARETLRVLGKQNSLFPLGPHTRAIIIIIIIIIIMTLNSNLQIKKSVCFQVLYWKAEGERATPLYRLCRYVWSWRVRFLSNFDRNMICFSLWLGTSVRVYTILLTPAPPPGWALIRHKLWSSPITSTVRQSATEVPNFRRNTTQWIRQGSDQHAKFDLQKAITVY